MRPSFRGGAVFLCAGLVLSPVANAQPAANGQNILAHVRRTGLLTCAAESRPGFATMDEQGEVHGLAVDLCRAVAIAVAGPNASVRMTLPEADNEFAALAHGATNLAFLSAEAIAEHHLAGALIPGPVVFIDPIALMAPVSAKAQRPEDLAGHTICLMIGSPAQRALEATLGTAVPPIARLAFREDVEMLDAYNVGRCDGVVADATYLAEMRLSPGINHLQSRILLPPLALTPFVATTPAGDGAWASRVGWILNGLLAETAAAPSLLHAQWRNDVRAALGSYTDMRERNLGAGSPLKLPPWPNEAWPNGLLVPLAIN
jgi:general L-amino acid transport system substrate-binding protein